LSSGDRETERDRQTDRQRARSEKRLEDFLSVEMGRGSIYYVMISSSVVKRMMTSMLIIMIADAELNEIRSRSSDMLDTVLKMTDFDNSKFKSNKIVYILYK
jgi:hypothetical protein